MKFFTGFSVTLFGVLAMVVTKENFNYCTQQILSSITGPAVEPYAFVVSIFYGVVNQLNISVQYVRAIFDRIRNVIIGVIRNIMNRLLNLLAPLQNIIIGAKDIFNKCQGILTSILYSVFGAYLSFKSLLGLFFILSAELKYLP